MSLHQDLDTRGVNGARIPWASLALLVILAAFWGASYSLIRVAVATIPPITLMALRTMIAGALLWAFAAHQGQSPPRASKLWLQFAVQAAFNSVLPFTLIAWAEQRLAASVAVILNALSPILALLGTWLITRHERVTARRAAGAAIGLVGVALTLGPSAFTGWNGELLPKAAVLLASFCYASAALYGQTFRGLSPLLPAAGSMTCGALVLLPASLLVDEPWSLHISRASVVALLTLAVVSTALAYAIYFRLLQTLGSIGVASQAFLRVPIGVALGVAVLHEHLATTAWIGMTAVVLGVALMTAMDPRGQPTSPAVR